MISRTSRQRLFSIWFLVSQYTPVSVSGWQGIVGGLRALRRPSTKRFQVSFNGDDEQPEREHNHHHSDARMVKAPGGIFRFGRKSRRALKGMSEELSQLQEENLRLRAALHRVEAENERLVQEFDNRIILETFEGEGKLRRYAEEHRGNSTLALSSDDQPDALCSVDDGACPIEPTVSFGEAFRDRAYWLVGLLAMQSCSGFILSHNEALLANHPVIIYFLTMLVGAGGNAGNQASVRVIRGLALGTLTPETQRPFLVRELKMAVSLSGVLSLAGFLRAIAFRTPLPETIAVTAALGLIVFSSVCLGAVLPILLKKINVDPAHSSTTIQVIMDILGVVLAVIVSGFLLDSPIGALLVSRLSSG